MVVAMGPSGLPAGLPELLGICAVRGAENDGVAHMPRPASEVESDPALRALVEAWPVLPEHVRATIRMLVESARPERLHHL